MGLTTARPNLAQMGIDSHVAALPPAPYDPSHATLDAVVVGAGIAGLTCARHLLHQNKAIAVLERETRHGGVWNSPHLYQAVRLQQHKSEFRIRGVAWPENTSPFPDADEVRALVQRFVKHFDLEKVIRYQSEVTSATFDETERMWTVVVRNGDVILARHLIWAGGALGSPVFPPSLAKAFEKFSGDALHASEYYRPTPFHGRRVAVIGWGASGVEIAADLARSDSCDDVCLLVRQGDARATSGVDWCLSRDLYGGEGGLCARYSASGPARPLDERNADVQARMRERHGAAFERIPESLRFEGRRPPLNNRIIVSEALYDEVEAGRLRIVEGEVTGASGTTLTLTKCDGTTATEEFDAVIVCTGYTGPLPAMQKTLKPAPKELSLYQTIFSPDVPQFAALACVYGFVAVPMAADTQARIVARVVCGDLELPKPAEMNAWIEQRIKESPMGTTQCLTDDRFLQELEKFAAYDSVSESLGKDVVDAAVERGLKMIKSSSMELSDMGKKLLSNAFKDQTPKEAYDLWAQTYDDDSFGDAGLGFDSPHTCAAMTATYLNSMRPFAGRPCLDLLDVGCGTGMLTRLVRQRLTVNVDAKGFDLSDKMLDIARKHDGLLSEVVCHSLSDTPWPYADATFDVAMCNGVLIYIDENFSGIIDEFARVLRPGGYAVLMIREDNVNNWSEHLDRLERARTWRLLECTEPRDNFPNAANEGGEAVVWYRMYVFKRLAPTA